LYIFPVPHGQGYASELKGRRVLKVATFFSSGDCFEEDDPNPLFSPPLDVVPRLSLPLPFLPAAKAHTSADEDKNVSM